MHVPYEAQEGSIFVKSTGMISMAAWAAVWLAGASATPAAANEAAQPAAQTTSGQGTACDLCAAPLAVDTCASGACSACPCSQLIYNPAFGDDIYHTHPAGGGMFGVKYMHMDMQGLRDGTHDVDLDEIGFRRGRPYNYMMIPKSMTMDMYMFMAMYGITDRLTLMGMANYQANAMRMLMDMGPPMPPKPDPTMRTSGFGDTEVRGIYQLTEVFAGSLGLSLPTGDIDQSVRIMGMNYHAPYDMQLGSGSFDLKPALTYSELSGDGQWNWGAQAQYTWHTADNANGYRLGDSAKLDSWLQRALGPATVWLRLAYSHTDSMHGRDPDIQRMLGPAMMAPSAPDADPNNYGGERMDGAVGASCKIGRFSIGVEGGVPLYQDLNGLQLKTDWFLTAGVQAMF